MSLDPNSRPILTLTLTLTLAPALTLTLTLTLTPSPHPCPCPNLDPTPNQDLYEYDLNCKSIAANLASVRGLPDLKMLGLPRNVLVWDGEQLGTWLDALGLGQVVPAYPVLNPTKAVPLRLTLTLP